MIARLRYWLLAMLALPALGAPAAQAIDIGEVVTPLGIRAWLVEDRSTPVVALSFSFAGGTPADPDGRRGITALTARLLTDGAGSFAEQAFKRRLEDAATSVSFGASFDRVSGSARFLSANRDEAFDLLRLAMTQPRLEAESLRRERARVVAALNQAEQRPASVAARTMMATMFAGHPYGGDPDGVRADLEAVQPEDLKRRAQAMLGRTGLIVSAVGDIDAAELARQLDRAFGPLPAGGLRPPPPDWTPPPRGRTMVVERGVPQSVVAMALPGVPRDDPDWYPAFMMNHVLGGGGMQSRLFTEVREKRGLAYGVSSSLRNYRKAALFVTTTASANERVSEAIRTIRGEFARLREGGITPAELADARTFLTGSLALSLESSSSIASLLHSMQIDGLPPDHLRRRAELIAAVRAEDVQRAARRILRDEALLTVVVGRPQGVATGD